MKPRQVIAGVAFAFLLLVGLGVKFIVGIDQDDWDPAWALPYTILTIVALFVTFYDRKNIPQKFWDFSPRRGVLYFLLGWIIFPLGIAVDALLGTAFTWIGILVFTAIMSVLAGIVGTFTTYDFSWHA